MADYSSCDEKSIDLNEGFISDEDREYVRYDNEFYRDKLDTKTFNAFIKIQEYVDINAIPLCERLTVGDIYRYFFRYN